MAMIKYPKIESLFDRDPKTSKFIEGQYRLPEFQWLAKNQWQFTEKINGMNIRVKWLPTFAYLDLTAWDIVEETSDYTNVAFAGRTDNAQIPPFLLDKLRELFPVSKLSELYHGTPMCLYGEGFGANIRKGGKNYISDGVSFACFDIRIGDLWLEWHNVVDICGKLGIETVPVMGSGNIHSAVDWIITTGIKSYYGDFPAEGLVLRPEVPLLTRRGKWIIAKIKHSDFA